MLTWILCQLSIFLLAYFDVPASCVPALKFLRVYYGVPAASELCLIAYLIRCFDRLTRSVLERRKILFTLMYVMFLQVGAE